MVRFTARGCRHGRMSRNNESYKSIQAMKAGRIIWLPALAVIASANMAPTCGDRVIIPASDSTRPDVSITVIDSQNSVIVPSNARYFVDPTETLTILPNMDDQGGARDLDLSWRFSALCFTNTVGTSISGPAFASDSQPGQVGDEVRSGLYLIEDFDIADEINHWSSLCNRRSPGSVLASLSYRFSAFGRDFAGLQGSFGPTEVIVRLSSNAPGPGVVFLNVCGNRILESAEQCDDGNTRSGDGCSSTCRNEPPPPCSGNRTRCNGRCVDLRSDPANCGSCGNICRSFEQCIIGVCEDTSR